MLGETEKSSDVCRTASLSQMVHEQRAATSSTVTDQRRKNFFVRSALAVFSRNALYKSTFYLHTYLRRSSFEIEVPPNRRVLWNGDDFG